jgi:ketosteroid isomerase-like protein
MDAMSQQPARAGGMLSKYKREQRPMHKTLTAVALMAFLVTSAASASDKTDVMSVVHRWIDAMNRGDMKSFVALCADQASILDDFPPYQWQGPGACANWWNDAKSTEATDFAVTLGKPLQIYVDGDHAYVVTRDSATFKDKGKAMKQAGSIHAFALLKSGSGWRISSEAWADTVAATPIKGKDAGRD